MTYWKEVNTTLLITGPQTATSFCVTRERKDPTEKALSDSEPESRTFCQARILIQLLSLLPPRATLVYVRY